MGNIIEFAFAMTYWSVVVTVVCCFALVLERVFPRFLVDEDDGDE